MLESLWRLLYGFQAADEFSGGELLRDVLRRAPNDVYGGLLATIMRMVFTLYAEDGALLPTDSQVYAANYGLLGLFERLREDNARFPDTMTERFGAWPQLLTLFRLLHDGASHGTFRLPPRHGRLFDPDVYPFLEGRTIGEQSSIETLNIPRISDAVVYGILDKLLYLDGDRLSYAALDVSEIGSVYEAMMGFELEETTGRAIGVKPKTKKGVRADVIIDLDKLLTARPADRAKLLKEVASAEVSGKSLEALKSATTPEQIVDALGNRVSPYTPRILPKGTMALQPSEERRRSGLHYTPRSLTQPIVQTTLQPILDQLCGDPQCAAFEARNDPKHRDPVPGCIADDGEQPKHRHPRPEQILDLKVCDPAMGSGAFLVEACRFLGDALVRAWQIHGGVPAIPPDEDIILYARRRIAQQCLYGVDRNPFAVDLAKLSLWLATLAKDHPFTFLDHALRHGDSLVGLSRDQIVYFDWEESDQLVLELSDALKSALVEAEAKRDRIHELSDSDDTDEKQRLLAEAEAATRLVRTAGDLLIAAFFAAEKDRDRRALRASVLDSLRNAIRSGAPIDERAARELRSGVKPLPPFHWFLEFPEVFSRSNSGFDVFIGNPPFAGKNTLIKSNRDVYPAWLKVLHEHTHGNADLIAQFFRRAFNLTRACGTFGLIATNTIAQGDTRGTGLRWICKHDGTIYEARKRVKWPGAAAVVVSVIHVRKGSVLEAPRLDGHTVDRITAFLVHAGGHDDPLPLRENAGKSFQGSIILGIGFTFDDGKEEATPTMEMHRLIAQNPRNAGGVFPYIGGEEVNESPTHERSRYVIGFGEMSEDVARANWPDLMDVVQRKVKPDRDKLKGNPDAEWRRKHWWLWGRYTPALFEAVRGLDRVLACSLTSKHWAIAFLPATLVFDQTLIVFALSEWSHFALLQSRVHEVWKVLQGGSLEDRPRYNVKPVFETFPFAPALSALELDGLRYYKERSNVMSASAGGFTDTYNRFHDPEERHHDILKLRELHDAMDRAVLDAYGWTDIQPRCEFILDYEDEEEAESTSRRKKPWRYRWPDDIRDEVLARLLALNAERAKKEQLRGALVEGQPARRVRSKVKAPAPLFDVALPKPAAVPAFANVADGAWARPAGSGAGDEAILLATVLGQSGPSPARDVRLAAMLASEPALLTPSLDSHDASEWKRVIGPEALTHHARPDLAKAWGDAVIWMDAAGYLVDDGSGVWSPGPASDSIPFADWHLGRVRKVLEVLARNDRDVMVSKLPQATRGIVNAA